MGRLFVLAGLLWALSAAPAWAGNVATPLMGEVASWAAGKPLAVHCESDAAEWDRMVVAVSNGSRRGPTVNGYTFVTTPKIWLGPTVCPALVIGTPTSSGFGQSLVVLLHEAVTHRGFRLDSAQQCAAVLLHYDALRRFYKVQFFSALQRSISAGVMFAWSLMPPEYQGCPL